MRTEDRSRTRPVRRVALATPSVAAAAAPSAASANLASAVANVGTIDASQAQWLWYDRSVWKPYDVAVSAKLETAHQARKQRVDIDTERYVDLSSLHQCRHDDPRRRRKVRRDAGATASRSSRPTTSFAPDHGARSPKNKGVTVSNVTLAAPIVPSVTSGAVAGRADPAPATSRAPSQAKEDDSNTRSGATTTSSSNSSKSSGTGTAIVESDDEMDMLLQARIARFATKKTRPTSAAGVTEPVVALTTTLSADVASDAATKKLDKTDDLIAKRSHKVGGSSGSRDAEMSSSLASSIGVQSLLPDGSKGSAARPTRRSNDLSQDDIGNSLPGAAPAAFTDDNSGQSWCVLQLCALRNRNFRSLNVM